MNAQQIQQLRERAAAASVHLGRGKAPATSSADPQANKRRRRAEGGLRLRRGDKSASVESNEALPEIQPHALVQVAGLGRAEDVDEIAAELMVPDGTPPIVFHDDPRIDLRVNQVFQLWLRGYTRSGIQEKLQLTKGVVIKDLKRVRDGIRAHMEAHPSIFGGPLQALVMQVARRRDRQASMWEQLEEAPPQVKPQYFRLMAEEDTAVERLLGLDKKTLEIILGSPTEHAQGQLMRTMGPEGLRALLADIRETHQSITGQAQIIIRDGVGINAPATDQSRD